MDKCWRATVCLVLVLTGIADRAMAASDPRQLIESAGRRLALAPVVAHAKWVSGQAIEDVARENQVIGNAVHESGSTGLDAQVVRAFFADQILASKLVQIHLMAQWRRGEALPEGPVPDLAHTVRPELDELQHQLILGLSQNSALQRDSGCRLTIAVALQHYADERKLDEWLRGVLDIAFSHFCIGP